MSATDGLVFLDPAREDLPGTHVLIVGVGHYAFAIGGSSNPTRDARLLPQLTSPPVSARAIADWFIRDFKNSDRDLASVSLLLSEAGAPVYTPPTRPGAQNAIQPPAGGAQIPAADHDNLKLNAVAWAQRLQKNKDNMSVFYFCGHGMSKEAQVGLMLRDFGGDPFDFLAAP